MATIKCPLTTEQSLTYNPVHFLSALMTIDPLEWSVRKAYPNIARKRYCYKNAMTFVKDSNVSITGKI